MVYKAKKKDIKSLELLLKELFAQEKEFKYKKGLHAKAIEKILKKKKVGRIFVYKIEDKIVGMVSLLYSYSTALSAKVGIVEDMIVQSDYRGIGVGSALLEHLIEYANKKGLKRLTLLTDADNELAQKMYGKFGFKHSEMIVLRKGL
ncbi:GNAT family N-acetyltransferase [Sulfurimonas sp. C5]|uniref:GNAT family N-acetyltransferase n=1 Tax=Sulfurimonas sp. C5 TaxID=3036947 RepID=UPI002456184C|nr:GNAT family N-acetyltransferase [Sulfurimonas sp. C5]MDH4945303.1 GNAT family N-acetyltransferase [Sulfurimonas sp. C5]